MTVSTRPESPGADEPFLHRLILESLTRELGADQWPQPMRDHLLGMQYNGRRNTAPTEYPKGQSRIVLADGAPAGWLYTADVNGAVYIAEIMVVAERRSQGIGSAILREVIASAGEQPVRLTVNPMNSGAVRLYERLGFRRIGGDDMNHVMEYRR